MFTMQAAMSTILQACCMYSNGNIQPRIKFDYIDQANNTTELDDLTIDVANKTAHEITMAIGGVIPAVVKQFNIDLNQRYVMVCKIDTFTPDMKVTLKTVLLPVAMNAIRQWEDSCGGAEK
ncbi:MAG: hypothetical protein NC489_08160 [Ruminococcus flavefaciens]|nr:hypothetical protein [Ruminococcus flavefaciens]